MLWFFYPLLPWGIGLMIHYLVVFGLPFTKILTAEWEQQELQKELERLEKVSPNEDENEDADELKLKSLEKRKAKGWSDGDLV